MRITRLLTGLVAVAMLGLMPVVLATSAEAAPRPITIKGIEPKNNQFFIKGSTGADYAKQKIKVERRDRPGAAWKAFSQPRTNSKGNFKVRVFAVRGSSKTCYRVKTKAVGGLEKSTSDVLCITVI